MNRDLTVFQLAAEYTQLERLVDSEIDVPESDLIEAWMTCEGDLNHKMENLGFAIRNREAILSGKQEAIKSMESSAMSLEKEIDRLKALALSLLHATGHKKAGGQYLQLAIQTNPPKVGEDLDLSVLPAEYFREIPPVPASRAPDKKRILDDMKQGVIVPGAKMVQGNRLVIK